MDYASSNFSYLSRLPPSRRVCKIEISSVMQYLQSGSPRMLAKFKDVLNLLKPCMNENVLAVMLIYSQRLQDLPTLYDMIACLIIAEMQLFDNEFFIPILYQQYYIDLKDLHRSINGIVNQLGFDLFVDSYAVKQCRLELEYFE